MATAFIYSDAYLDYDYGPTHPLKIIRLKLAYELIQAYGLLSAPSVNLLTPKRAGDEDLALFLGLLAAQQANHCQTGVDARPHRQV